jgi:hypothetical protein
MKKQFFALAFAFAAFFAGTPAAHATAPISQSAPDKVTAAPTVAITGILAGISSFAGNFEVQRFITQNGELIAVGSLTGSVTNLLTGVTQSVSQIIQIPVASATGTCEILSLVLGPLDLDLLGLQVHLDQVVLNIDAQSGPGQLLGNLLCAITNLLNGGGPLTALQGLLNRILAIL